MLTIVEARGSVNVLGPNEYLRVLPDSNVASLTFRMVCRFAPSLLKPALRAKVDERLRTVQTEARRLAEALQEEEELERQAEQEVSSSGLTGHTVSDGVRQRAAWYPSHRRWRVEARRRGRIVQLSRAMLLAGRVASPHKLAAIFHSAIAASSSQPAAPSDRQETFIGVIQQVKANGSSASAPAVSLSPHPVPPSPRRARIDQTLDDELLMEETLYQFRHAPLHSLCTAMDAQAAAAAAAAAAAEAAGAASAPADSHKQQKTSSGSGATSTSPVAAHASRQSTAAVTPAAASGEAMAAPSAAATGDASFPAAAASSAGSAVPPSAAASSASKPLSNGYQPPTAALADAYVSFTPRAWCDGAYLRSSLSLAASHLSHSSTVYLMFECPHAHSRGHRESVYAVGGERRGFAIFVRHSESRSLLRMNVHVMTKVWRVKLAAVRQCFDWDDEGLELLDREKKRRHDEAARASGAAPAAKAASWDEQEAQATFDQTAAAAEDDDDTEASAAPAPSDRCVLLHNGRVCFDSDSLAYSGIGPGDVLVLLEKQLPSDDSIDPERYAAAGWYGARMQPHLVERSTVFDLQACLVQLRERVDEIVYRPEHVARLQQAFKLMDSQHSNHLQQQQLAYTLHAVLRLLQQRIAADERGIYPYWLVELGHRTGGSEVAGGGGRWGFLEPCMLPVQAETNFQHFLRLLSDCLVEIVRERQLDLMLPSQTLSKPGWWTQDHLNRDNLRLLHTVFSTLPALNSQQQQRQSTDAQAQQTAGQAGPTEAADVAAAPMLQTLYGRAGLDSLHGVGLRLQGEDGGRAELEDAYILSQVLAAEQERQAQEEEHHNIHRGFTFSARKRHDRMLDTFMSHLARCLAEDLQLDKPDHSPVHLLSYARTGVATVLSFLFRPFLLLLDLSSKLWQQRETGRDGWLQLCSSLLMLLLYIAALSGFFYTPFLLVAVYFLYCSGESGGVVTVLESLIPLVITCLLIAYKVNDAVSAQLLSLETDEQRLSEAYAASRLLCLEMRAQPVLMDFEGKAERRKLEAQRRKEEMLSAISEGVHLLSAAAGDTRDVEAVLAKHHRQQLLEQGAAGRDNARSARVAPMPEQRPSLSLADYAVRDGKSALPPPPPPPPNPIGKSKSKRLLMSNTVLHFRLGTQPEGGEAEAGGGDLFLWQKLLFLLLSIVQTAVPGIYRAHSGQPFFGSSWYDQLVSAGSWVCIPAVYLFLTNLGQACMGYHQLSVRLDNVTVVASAARAFELRFPFYLDIRHPGNLQYWLALRETAKEVDTQLIGMVAGAVLLDGALLVAAVIRVIFFHVGADLFNVTSVAAIALYSLFILTFLLIVVQANSRLSDDHLQLIQTVRHHVSFAMCDGEPWRAMTLGLRREEGRPLDNWSEVSTFDAEDAEEEQEEVREMEEAVLASADRPTARTTASRRSSAAASPAAARCHHGLAVEECMTCALQAHTSSLHARHSLRLQSVHTLLSSLHSHSVDHQQHDVTAYGYYRFSVESHLLDATIQHLQAMDEPVSLLGLTVNQDLLMKAIAAIVTGGVSALSSVLPL